MRALEANIGTTVIITIVAFGVERGALAEVQALYDEDSNEECVEKATDALNKYGKALERAQEALARATRNTRA